MQERKIKRFKTFIKDLVFNNPRADAVISDAAFVRMKRYRSLFLPTEGSKKRKQIQGASFIHGWNELNLHELLMMDDVGCFVTLLP